MWEKFKSLNVFLKILIVIIAIGMLPATLFFLSIVLFVTLFKKKKKIACIMSLILVALTFNFANFWYSMDTTVTASNTKTEETKNTDKKKLEEKKTKEEADKKKEQEEQKKQEELKKAEEQKKQEEKKVQTEQQKKDEEAKKIADEKKKQEDNEKKAQAEQTKKNELVKKLETYENIYLMIPASIEEKSASNNALELQKTFSTGRDVASKCWQELGDLKDKYSTESNEYKAIQNLQLAFFVVKDACKNGIKYLDKNEYKYYEKYEKNCNEAGAWYSDFVTLKEKIK
ncbi:TPA: hypothetical protein KO029_003609 [Clostridioides difficile]|nr:hypothetical protein [Clostridioides difficile]HCU2759743.1 hypothetical protein [Clostridioides difficile]